jgi:hypothetical protein
MDVTVYNRYPDIELISPVYLCNCGIYHEYPIERADIGVMVKASFRFGLDQDEPEGILMYEVQRNGNANSDHQPNTDTTSTGITEDASKMMRLIVAWKINHSLKFNVRMVLVEHDNELVLDEDKLEQLHKKVNDIPSEEYDLLSKYNSIFKST